MELQGNLLCPFTQRAYYALSLKSVDFLFTEKSIQNFSDSSYPKLFIEGRVIEQSLVIAELADQFAGFPLYPSSGSPSQKRLKKASIDSFMQGLVQGFSQFVASFLFQTPTQNEIKRANRYLATFAEVLAKGQYLFSAEIGYDNFCIADLALYPFVERILICRETYWKDLVVPQEVENWYHHLQGIHPFDQLRIDRNLVLELLETNLRNNKASILAPITQYTPAKLQIKLAFSS